MGFVRSNRLDVNVYIFCEVNEMAKWYTSRRLGAAVLAAVTAGLLNFFPEHAQLIGTITSLLGGALATHSYVSPDKK